MNLTAPGPVPRGARVVINHNHITQSADGVEGCPACERIDNWHMTQLYVGAQLLERVGRL